MKLKFTLTIALLLSFSSRAQTYKEMIDKGTFSVSQIQIEAAKHFDTIGKGRGTGYKQFKRWEYNALRLADENGFLKSDEYYYEELERINSSRNNSSKSSQVTTQGNWEEMGPTYWNAGASGYNPGVGRVTALSVDAGNPDHIIVSSTTGGVWRTYDEGATWSVLTDNLLNMKGGSLLINPFDSTSYFWGSTSGIIYTSTDSGATWSVLGTVDGGGTINKIIMDPTDANHMYVSASGNGIFRSIDGGVNWDLIHPDSVNGYDVEFKPGDSSVIYASGTDYFQSNDSGNTFTKYEISQGNETVELDQEYESGTANWVVASSNNSDLVTAKTGDDLALFFSNNFDDDTTSLILPVQDLSTAANPKVNFSFTNEEWYGDVDILVVKYKTSATGAWQTLQTYDTENPAWVDVTLDLPNPSSEYFVAFQAQSNYAHGVTLDDVSITANTTDILFETGFEVDVPPFAQGPKMIAVTPDNPDVVYVVEADDNKFGALYKSINAGQSFTKLNHPGKNYFGSSSTASDNKGQAPRDMAIAVNPNNENEIHLGGLITFMSIDGGITFNVTAQWAPNVALNQNIGYCHADIDIMEYVNGKLYIGSDGGVFVADNPQTVNSDYYRDLSTGLGIRQFYKIGVSQTNPEQVTGGSQDNGQSVYTNTGVWKDWFGADGMESFVDKNDPNILYGMFQNGVIVKTTNQGDNATNLGSPENKVGNWVTPFEQDHIVPNTIYAGYDQVHKSSDGGLTWTAVSQVFVPPVPPAVFGRNISHLKISPENSNVMYASYDNVLYKTSDGGTTDWAQVTGFTGKINAIALHPTDENKIAMAMNNGKRVWVSNDGGATWISYKKNLPAVTALAVAWDDNPNNGLFVGMRYGVFYIDDSFTNWQTFTNNLPNIQINELEINYANDKIYAGTYGRGLWRADVFDSTALDIDEFVYFNELSISPNPATTHITINWDKNADVSIKIYNTLGKLMAYHKDVNVTNGHNVDVSKFATGVYFVSINDSKAQITKKIIIK